MGGINFPIRIMAIFRYVIFRELDKYFIVRFDKIMSIMKLHLVEKATNDYNFIILQTLPTAQQRGIFIDARLNRHLSIDTIGYIYHTVCVIQTKEKGRIDLDLCFIFP